MKTYGYARVSTEEQSLNAQLLALESFGCDTIFQEKESGRKKKRPALDKLLHEINAGDSIVIWKLDRLGRTTKQLIDLTSFFKKKITLISLKEQLDTRTPLGKFYFTLMAVLAEMEVDLIRERTLMELNAARLEGPVGGRPTISQEKIQEIQRLFQLNRYTFKEISMLTQVSVSTVHKYIHLMKEKQL